MLVDSEPHLGRMVLGSGRRSYPCSIIPTNFSTVASALAIERFFLLLRPQQAEGLGQAPSISQSQDFGDVARGEGGLYAQIDQAIQVTDPILARAGLRDAADGSASKRAGIRILKLPLRVEVRVQDMVQTTEFGA